MSDIISNNVNNTLTVFGTVDKLTNDNEFTTFFRNKVQDIRLIIKTSKSLNYDTEGICRT